MRALIGALALAAVVGVALASRGPDPDARPSPDDVYNRVMSPYCPGLTLSECPSSKAADLRERISSRLAAGATNAEIDSWLRREYGETIVSKPEAIGWVIPAFLIALGAGLMIWRVGRKTVNTPAMTTTEADRAIVERELETFRGGTE